MRAQHPRKKDMAAAAAATLDAEAPLRERLLVLPFRPRLGAGRHRFLIVHDDGLSWL
jgi:hypothetical protein